MKKTYNCIKGLQTGLVISSLVFSVTGCAFFSAASCEKIPSKIAKKGYPRSVVKDVDWSSQEDAIVLDFWAADNLNTYQGAAHSLLVKIYQFSDKSTFRKMSSTPAGLAKLLSSRYSHGSLVATDQYTLYPGKSTKISFNRESKSKYVAIVAGFFRLVPGRVAVFSAVPLEDISNWYNIWGSADWEAQILQIEVAFGARSLRIINRKYCKTV